MNRIIREDTDSLNARGIWVTKDRTQIPVNQLQDGHLQNIAHQLAQRAQRVIRQLETAGDEGEELDILQSLDEDSYAKFELGELEWHDVLRGYPIWPHIETELAKRGFPNPAE